jgi:hypothetical protein
MPDIHNDVERQYQTAANRFLQETNTALGNYTINVYQGKSANIDVLFSKDDSKENN